MELEYTNKYKYLGHMQNEQNNLQDHLKCTRAKVEAAYQKLIALTGNATFHEIEMETIWTVVETCILPIITYSGEAWGNSKKDYKEANTIYENILKRILKTPQSTPREALYIETGLIDPETLIKRNRINMQQRIKRGSNQMMKTVLTANTKGGWAQTTEQIKAELQIHENDLNASRATVKKSINKKAMTYFQQKITQEGKDKSKVQHLLSGRENWQPGKRPEYMNKLTRKQASTIFQARTRMLKVKNNYKNGNSDLMCRLCKEKEETQKHILEECLKIHTSKETQSIITTEMIFAEDTGKLKEYAKRISEHMETLHMELETKKERTSSKRATLLPGNVHNE